MHYFEQGMMETTTVENSSYLADRMDEVSRSFALVVKNLEEPLREHLATAYLLCRVADNIEDCGQPAQWQVQRFEQFRDLLIRPTNAGEVLSEWEQLEWPHLTDDEFSMMGLKQGLPLWQIYATVGERERRSITNWVSIMANGMQQLAESDSPPQLECHNDIDCLATVPDYNEYCYYVAGTVGHMATEIVAYNYNFSPELTTDLSDLSEACGRSLQKTNIIKDFRKDIDRGISYIPGTWLEQADFAPLYLQGAPPEWTHMVIDDVLQELHSATEYLQMLPIHARGYRVASLLCLLPAYETLLLAAKQQGHLFTSKHQVKISRVTMMKCQLGAQSMVSDNDAIQGYAHRMEDEIQAAF